MGFCNLDGHSVSIHIFNNFSSRLCCQIPATVYPGFHQSLLGHPHGEATVRIGPGDQDTAQSPQGFILFSGVTGSGSQATLRPSQVLFNLSEFAENPSSMKIQGYPNPQASNDFGGSVLTRTPKKIPKLSRNTWKKNQ